jgi:hypothetical protein
MKGMKSMKLGEGRVCIRSVLPLNEFRRESSQQNKMSRYCRAEIGEKGNGEDRSRREEF